ncbi:DNA-protecting protein DprA [Bifidobacterium sp. ESL0775]|uniref:DNA-processing protein DprA n=1 Tax=Bifidobacterium sp. ESL0775 TaxID=2983230 RepID=UPI0023F66F18|nr:DNA-processing protein DprA [Bifidobacterium sp. ESL0775]WEV68828.1 DNA-protecting protein DprA [Bifidobacterium sp. ESL0775]
MMNEITQATANPSPAMSADRKSVNTSNIDEDMLARAILTFCVDSADALLFATIKGAGDAVTALRLIADDKGEAANRNRLDEAFATGTAKWGRKVNTRGMSSFHHGLERWRERLRQLPSSDAQELTEWFSAGGAQWIIGPASPYWPAQLDDLSIRKDWASPLCLWGIGDPAALTSCPQPLAVVGSRGADDYGRYVARTIAKKAAEQGHLVVSGGAFGIDAAAHWGALDAMNGIGEDESGRTVAVFAGGLNHIGPERNQPLFNRIKANGGALISELCPDTIPEARRFLLRNRIIAALASTVVVAQARSRSGALNTANWAAELGRVVYAAPGNINTPGNTGCNWLIRDQRATILTSVNDIDEICHKGHAPKVIHSDDRTTTRNNTETEESLVKAPIPAISTDAKEKNHECIDHSRKQSHNTDTGNGHAAMQIPLPSRAEASQAEQGNGAMGHDSSGHPLPESPTSKAKPTLVQQEVLTGIRRCRRRGDAATHEAILMTLNTPRSKAKHGPAAQHQSNDITEPAKPWNIGKLESMLGEMELLGMVEQRFGTVHIISGNAGRSEKS